MSDERDRVLGEVLAERLVRHKAPAALRERVVAQLGGRARPARARRLWVPLVSALAGAALVLAVTSLRAPSAAPLVQEAVNDHLRVVASTHPVEIESGGIHQVKPWFTGKLDFAPRVAFAGDDDFPLVGGATGWFRDRAAAVFVWKRRLHTITLLVFRAEGLPWPTRGLRELGRLHVDEAQARGFNVLLWRDGDLGYALVSDVNAADLAQLAARL
jgi:anti-sigma factor RsiW